MRCYHSRVDKICFTNHFLCLMLGYYANINYDFQYTKPFDRVHWIPRRKKEVVYVGNSPWKKEPQHLHRCAVPDAGWLVWQSTCIRYGRRSPTSSGTVPSQRTILWDNKVDTEWEKPTATTRRLGQGLVYPFHPKEVGNPYLSYRPTTTTTKNFFCPQHVSSGFTSRTSSWTYLSTAFLSRTRTPSLCSVGFEDGNRTSTTLSLAL